VTHIYLLIGVSLPIVAEYIRNNRDSGDGDTNKLSASLGVISVGVGDAAAAVIGIKFGRRNFPFTHSSKSLEGVVGFFLASIATSAVLLLWQSPQEGPYQVLPVVFTMFLSALFEAWTGDIDNLLLPLFTYVAYHTLSM